MRCQCCALLVCWLACLVWATPDTPESLQDEVEKTPDAPDWSQYFKQLPALGRRIRVASPCVGIHGCGHALNSMKVGADSIHVYDLDHRYGPYLTKHLQEMGMGLGDIMLHLGKLGDLLQLPLRSLKGPIDFLVAGPPCPPWAGQGKKQSLNDDKAKVFVRILEWAIFMIKCCGLIGLVLENVVGICSEPNGMESVMDKFVRVLSHFCPEFSFGVSKLRLVDYKSPQTRIRVFLRGFRKCFCPTLPPVLPPFGQADLHSALGNFPHTPRGTLSGPQQMNLRKMELKLSPIDHGSHTYIYIYI
jgi:site-specific DNA-cytosine methylase